MVAESQSSAKGMLRLILKKHTYLNKSKLKFPKYMYVSDWLPQKNEKKKKAYEE